MKKALSFAVALGLVAGLASVASAENMLSIHGDARWRGLYSQNTTDFTDHDVTGNQDTMQEMDQRYRFNMDLQVNDDVKINTRLVLWDNEFGNENGSMHDVDRANMSIKTLGGTWVIGRQEASWGNKFLAYGASVDRIKAVYKAGDLTYGGYLQKNNEGTYANGDGDNDAWGAFFLGKVGDMKWGVLLNYLKDDSNAVTYLQNTLPGSGVTYTGGVAGPGDTEYDPAGPALTREKGDTGYLIAPTLTAKVGPATVLVDLVYKGGDLVKKSNFDKSPFGGFVAGVMGMDAVTVKGLFAYYKDNSGSAVGGAGRDCDNDFAPSLLIGTCNETAIIDFGQTTNQQGDAAHADDSTWLLGAGVDFKANDKLTLGGLVGYLMASEYMGANGDEKGSLLEIDLTAEYELAQNATYSFGVAYADVSKFSAKDDSAFVVGNRVEVKW